VPVKPRVVTAALAHDTDDPAIWINRADPAKSLVIGTDKDTAGGLYAFDLTGKIVGQTPPLKRPNNVDIITGLMLGGKPTDIAVTTEREEQRLRVFRLPDLAPLDKGDLVVFDGDRTRGPMGIALYRRPATVRSSPSSAARAARPKAICGNTASRTTAPAR